VLIQGFTVKGQYRTSEKRRHLLNKIENFTGSRHLPISEISVSWLNDYESHLRTIGNKQNTIHTDLKIIKSILNYAVREGKLAQGNNPF
jgi:transcriptional antiterminator